jgi:hypothetical protein
LIEKVHFSGFVAGEIVEAKPEKLPARECG